MKHTTEITLEVTPKEGIVRYKEIMFEVEFEMNGCYRPATLTQPEEYSELSIESIRIGTIDGKRLQSVRDAYRESLAELYRKDSIYWFELTVEEFDSVIHEHCWDVAIDLKQDSDAQVCDYFDNLKEGWD